MPFASYAVDIGMYHVGGKGQMCSDTTTAWARSGEGTPSFDDITYSGSCDEGTFAKSTQRWSCHGRSISRLVDRIAADIDAGCSVSLGLEAPMWFPIGLEQCANLQLFKPRCEDERGSEWYVQSGAAATVKAVSIAAMLVNLLTSKQPGVKLTTDPTAGTNGTIILYEAFVVDEFKMPVPAGATQAKNEWDAFTASLAWGAVNWAFDIPPAVYPKKRYTRPALVPVGDRFCLWQIVASLVPSHPRVDGPLDCQIVGLTRVQN